MTDSVKKAYNPAGVDWIEVVIPPETPEEAEYTVRAHLTFLLSNWTCIYGQGCAGMFGVQESKYNDDAGCCIDSFYFSNREEIDEVRQRMEELTDEDWDQDLRKYVEKNGFVRMFKDSEDELEFKAKGKVFEKGCVFQNRNGGSSGKPGCAFVHMGQRKGLDHVDTMPEVCWQLPLRYGESAGDENIYELFPWDIGQWDPERFQFDDMRYTCSWWCVDAPDAYVGKVPVYKGMEREIRTMMGDRPYELLVQAIEARLASGNTYVPMPGAIVNDGRPLLPLLVGNRTPRREPSYYPAFLANMKEDTNNGNPG